MIAVFALAQLADGISAVLAVLSRPAFREWSTVPAMLLARPEWALVVKILAIILVATVCIVIDARHPRWATGLLTLGIVAGMIGLISNLAVLAA